jgi:hypothetical protein
MVTYTLKTKYNKTYHVGYFRLSILNKEHQYGDRVRVFRSTQYTMTIRP